MLLSTDAVDRVSELLSPADFYRDSHGSIFAACVSLRERGDPVEPLVLAAELERLGVLDSVGGKSRLAELAALVPSAGNVGHYAALVVESARARAVYRAAVDLQKAAANGGLAVHPEILDRMEASLIAARTLPGEPGEFDGPVFLGVHEFASKTYAPPEPLLGTDETAILARGSFNLLAGRPGTGKTTLLLDVVCHLAAGIPWPPADESERAPDPWPCPRPLNCAIIENEGPQEMFKAKVEDKLSHFPHPIVGEDGRPRIFVHTLHWGAFSFADRLLVEKARRELDEHQIDLVIGDPLASLGLEGVGSPAETTAFIQQLRPLGLGTHRAFLFLHHFRERAERDEDELSRLSGAWGGHLDTLLTLAATGKEDHARLAYPKIRWNKARPPQPIILGKVFRTRSFEALAAESDAGLLEPVIAKWLEDHRAAEGGKGKLGWETETVIAKGIGARRSHVAKCLEGAQHLFAQASKETKMELKARGNAKLWGLAGWQEYGVDVDSENPGQTSLAEGDDGDDEFPF
jgi:hypothetical protein